MAIMEIMTHDYDELKENDKKLNAVESGIQNSTNARLDGLRFRILNKSEFENTEHSIDQISFVRVFADGEFSHFELYKGDVLILPNATPPGPVNKFGKVVRINTAIDNASVYYSPGRQALTLPAGETISGSAIGFSGDTGSGTFLYSDATGKLLLGKTATNSSGSVATGTYGSSRLSIVVAHGNNKQTLTYEIIPKTYGPGANAGIGAYAQPYANHLMIKVNNTYYFGNNYWEGSRIGVTGTPLEGTIKNADEAWQQGFKGVSCYFVLLMPNIHNYNVPSGSSQFDMQLNIYVDGYGGWMSLPESSALYSRLGIKYSLDDGSYLGDPTYVECFVPGFTNYEDFLEIAKIICTPTTDSQGNEVII